LEIRGVSDRWGEVASVGVSACTIGGGIDERVEALLDERELPLAFMLDSLGSVVVEALAETLHRRLCADHLARGLKVSPRESPGYARWAIEEQRKLFALLPAGDIGLELNPYSIMTPRKSISFAVGIGPEAKMGASQSPCQSCDMRDCAYRRAPRRQPLAPAWASALGSLVLEFDHIKLAIP
jgi:cobalamin-dependent methionine synthase I